MKKINIFLIILTLLLINGCTSSQNFEHKEAIFNNTLRVYQKVDILLISGPLTEKKYQNHIKLAVMKRAYQLLKAYFETKTNKKISTNNEVDLFRSILKEPKLHIIAETEDYTKLFADFNIKLLNDYINEITHEENEQ
jgi:hypothetical protein